MINLLPQAQQKEIKAARSNTLLLRYLILLIGALLFLIAALGITYVALTADAARADAAKTKNEQAASGYSETQTAATELRNELTSAKTLFDTEVRYSKVLLRLSSLLPAGTAIESLSIDNASFTQPITLRIFIKGETQARQLQDNFKSSPYVTGVSMGRVSTSNEAGGEYPYTAELLFTFDRSIAQ